MVLNPRRAAAGLFVAASLCATPAVARPFRLEDVLAVREVRELATSPDGRSIAFVVREALGRESHRSSLWWAPLDGVPRRLTFEDDVEGVRWSPDGRQIAFIARRGAPAQAWALALSGGEARRLTSHSERVASMGWAQDGRLLFVAPRPEDDEEKKRHRDGDDAWTEGRQFRNHVLWIQERDGPPRALTSPDRHVVEAVWAPDGRRIAVVLTPTPEADSRPEARLAMVSAADGALHEVPGGDGAAELAWAADGKMLAFTRPHDGRDFARRDLHLWDGVGSPRNVSQVLDRDVEQLAWSIDGRAIMVLHAEGARHATARFDAAGRLLERGKAERALLLAQPTHDGLAFVPGDGPPEVWTSGPQGRAPRRLTELHREIEGVELPLIETLRWKTDAGDVEGVVARPRDAKGLLPLVVIPHGGPRGHTTAAFDGQLAFFVGRGYAVLRPNFRGSTAYGDAFARANVADWGAGPFRDVMGGVDALVARGLADPARLFLYGWSYGGYLANWAVTHTDRFRAIASGAGVADLRMQYVLSDARRWRFDYLGGSPFAGHHALYERESPVTHVAGARTPTLFVHGAEDRRVPLAQGVMMYRALKDAGVETELVVYPREGHTLNEPAHVLDRLQRVASWFARHGGP